MKVKIRDLRPNPFRDFTIFRIIRERVEALKKSIASTDFWENLEGRLVHGVVQIPYGHHRLAALQEMYPPTQEIEVRIQDFSDEQMIKKMAEENLDEYRQFPKSLPLATVHTVKTVKDHLEANPEIMAQYIQHPGQKNKLLVNGNRKAGKAVIARFLGGNWNESRVAQALLLLRKARPEDLQNASTMKGAVDTALAADESQGEKQQEQAGESPAQDGNDQKNANRKGDTAPREVLHISAPDQFRAALVEAGMVSQELARDWDTLGKCDQDIIVETINQFRTATAPLARKALADVPEGGVLKVEALDDHNPEESARVEPPNPGAVMLRKALSLLTCRTCGRPHAPGANGSCSRRKDGKK